MSNEIIKLTGLRDNGNEVFEISDDALILITQGGKSKVFKYSLIKAYVNDQINASTVSNNAIDVVVNGTATKAISSGTLIDKWILIATTPGLVKVGETAGGNEVFEFTTTTVGQTVIIANDYFASGATTLHFTATNSIIKIYTR